VRHLSQLIYRAIPSLRPSQIPLVQMDVALRDGVGGMPQQTTNGFPAKPSHLIRTGEDGMA
jgi:hypothetical protein